jgi:maltose-binding protein MalE
MFSKRWIVKIRLIFLLLLSACGDNQSARTNSQPQQESLQGHISIWRELPIGLSASQSSKVEAIIRAQVEDFTRLNPGVNVTVKFIPSGDSFASFVKQAERGAGPNLLSTGFTIGITRLIESGSLQALDNYQIALSSFRPIALQQVRYQGRLYGIPTNLQTQVLCYNKDKVKQPPNTLSELIDQARAGYSVGLHSNFPRAFWGTGIFGGWPFDERGRFMAGEGWAKWMKWLKEARDEPNFFLIEDAEELQRLFVEKKLAYITCWSGWLPALRDALGADSLGIALLPHATNRPATPLLLADVLLFNRASNPNQTRLALKLAQFLTNAEQQKISQTALPFMIPVNINVTLDHRLYPLQATLQEQARSGVVFSMAQIEKLGENFDYFYLLYQRVLGGEISPDEAAADLTRTINAPSSAKPSGDSR